MLKAFEVLNCRVVKSVPGQVDATLRIVPCVVLTCATVLAELHAVLLIVTELAALMVITILAVPTVWDAAGAIMSGASSTTVVTMSTNAW